MNNVYYFYTGILKQQQQHILYIIRINNIASIFKVT